MSIETLLNATVSGATQSSAKNLQETDGFYIEAAVGAALTVGTFKLQSSIDGTNWIDVASSSQSRADVIIWNVSDAIYGQVRVDISAVTGSDNVTIRCHTKIEY